MIHNRKIAVIGLGYVGLPLAIAFAQKTQVIAFDVNEARINALKRHEDWTHEVSSQELNSAVIEFTNNPDWGTQTDFYIIAVPTPVDDAHAPDLSCLFEASKIVGRRLKKGDIVVYESTVYPGATEEDCVPLLEQHSGLVCGRDFWVGYSPERINSGDRAHRFCDIVKVVAGCDAKTTEILAQVYGSVVTAGIYKAQSIKVAEAAKVIENTQRDLNIALMNELAMIFAKMQIDTQQVLQAASTKWNFMPFQPGLVGGHCIGVDPYYLTYKAKKLGYRPEVILSGRRINDSMGKYVAEQTIKHMIHAGASIKGAKVAILGLTFKENCSDLRNSKVMDVIDELQSYGVELLVHDPLALEADLKKVCCYKMTPWQDIQAVEAIVLCTAHQHYREMCLQDYIDKLASGGARVIADVKGMLNPATPQEIESLQDIHLWRL